MDGWMHIIGLSEERKKVRERGRDGIQNYPSAKIG